MTDPPFMGENKNAAVGLVRSHSGICLFFCFSFWLFEHTADNLFYNTKLLGCCAVKQLPDFVAHFAAERAALLFLFHTMPHATVNLRLTADLVKCSASSGMAFLNAVLSKRRLVTVFHVIL